jgi:hypothetical protein
LISRESNEKVQSSSFAIGFQFEPFALLHVVAIFLRQPGLFEEIFQLDFTPIALSFRIIAQGICQIVGFDSDSLGACQAIAFAKYASLVQWCGDLCLDKNVAMIQEQPPDRNRFHCSEYDE